MAYSQRYGTTTLRELWCQWACRGSEYGELGSDCGQPGSWADPLFYGKNIGGVPTVAVDAYHALERALMSEGYEASSVWAYNCRVIASSGKLSLHGMGIAVDIDPAENPQANIPPYSGKFTEAQVEAAMGIESGDGHRVWWWGGFWSGSTLPDLMHWQLDCTPTEALAIDWTTVPGAIVEPLPPQPPDEEDWFMALSDRKRAALEGMSDKALEEMTQAWVKAVDNPPDGTAGNQDSLWNPLKFYRVIADRAGRSVNDPSKVANQVQLKE